MRCCKPPAVPKQSPGVGPGGEAPRSLHLMVPEKRLITNILPMCIAKVHFQDFSTAKIHLSINFQHKNPFFQDFSFLKKIFHNFSRPTRFKHIFRIYRKLESIGRRGSSCIQNCSLLHLCPVSPSLYFPYSLCNCPCY